MTIIYHGSPRKFDHFDLSKIRSTNGTSEGVGLYFTTNRKIAAGYAGRTGSGYLYTVRFDGKKALSTEQLTMTEDEISRLIGALQKKGLDVLSNYGDVSYSGYGPVVHATVQNLTDFNTSDMELVSDLYNGLGENPDVLRIMTDTLGYDSAAITNPSWAVGRQTIYIALSADILTIENVEKIEN